MYSLLLAFSSLRLIWVCSLICLDLWTAAAVIELVTLASTSSCSTHFSCCSPIVSASTAGLWLHLLQLLLPDYVHLSCCSPIASIIAASPRLHLLVINHTWYKVQRSRITSLVQPAQTSHFHNTLTHVHN